MARLDPGLLSTLLLIAGVLAEAAEPHYSGSKICYGCHAEIYRSFVKTDMGRSMRRAADFNPPNAATEATISRPGSNRILRVFRDQSGWHQSESEPNVFLDEHTLDYTVGSGANGLSFLVRRGNRLFQAPLSYYSRAGKWDLSPGYEHGDYGFSRSTPEGCIYCHSGRAQPIPDRPGAYRDPPFEELAIGCENCHGPGEAHTRNPTRNGSIVNPAKLTPRLAENICMACHQTGDARVLQPGKTYQDFRPGEWLIDTVLIVKAPPKSEQQQHELDLLEHNEAMRASRCFRQSDGKLSCLTCHDPHRQPSGAEISSYFRQKCFTCHTDRSCKLPLFTRQQQTPPDDCIGCHMPERAVAVISHSALTNHRIPATPDEPLPPAKFVSDNQLMIVDQTEESQKPLSDIALLRAYSELANRAPEYQRRYLALLDQLTRSENRDPYVQAALAHEELAEGKNEEALTRLAIGIQLGEPAVYGDMGKALANLGRGDEAIKAFWQGLEIDPYVPDLRRNLISEYARLGRYSEARDAMKEYLTLFPEDDRVRRLLAQVTN
jgi:Tetratricopeptide repeat